MLPKLIESRIKVEQVDIVTGLHVHMTS